MIGNSWDIYLKGIYESEEYKKLIQKVNEEYKYKKIFPQKEKIFEALKLTDYNEVKVVIIGQDPYHGENEANGLCFSVNDGIPIPPSLKNILKELKTDLNIEKKDGDLTNWAKQGVLLLNTILTVEKDKPLSHKHIGWEIFTNHIIKELNKRQKPIIFVLWGKTAQQKQTYLTNSIHKVIISSHPSPFSAHKTFFESKPFSRINKYLKAEKESSIDFSK